ncbi:hypothetical protein F0562_013813 [Nyssa sinensis]|uniref:non-specific serine/threonine protein kinase n=1 Tax=Nyssa sinensis TaxID=561372 RepID=A0A5J4ZL44_9ASTE|nr:hypothetical protein F0562_013813 [Nyssa sinensis]
MSRAKEEDGSVFDHSMDDDFEKGSGPKKFSYGELATATNNFAEEEKLGEGGFGGVCRGFFRESNSFIVVKKVSSGSQQGIKEGKANKKSDVYSFRVVALEIACGRKAIDPNASESQRTMVEWVWNLYGMRRLLEAVDPKLGANFDEEEMERLMIVGLRCANPRHTDRPSIRQATRVLHSESPLPILPSKMPVPTISAPRASMATFLISSSLRCTDSESSQGKSSSYSSNPISSTLSQESLASSRFHAKAERHMNREQKAGRATYKEPLHLWDKAYGNLTDFDTNFSFIIDSEGEPKYGDGFACVLLPNHSDVLLTVGGAFGLPINRTTIENTSAFVAVEFDTYHNGLNSCDAADIQGTHVGIKINSLCSNASEEWKSNITHGKENKARIGLILFESCLH